MRKLSLLSIISVAALPSLASAAPQKCADAAGVDCLLDEVLVVNGAAMGGGKPVVNCDTAGACTVDYGAAVARALEIIGQVPDTQWDELLIMGQQMSAASNPSGPLFFREGYREDMSAVLSPGVNEVGGIGLLNDPAMTKRVPGRPFVGYIAAGGTNQVTINSTAVTGPPQYGACGAANASLCVTGFYNFFDALAQATGNIYGPYLGGVNDAAMMGAPRPNGTGGPVSLSVPPGAKTALVTMPNFATEKAIPSADFQNVRARIWNSFVDTQGSILGGNTFRDNGNGTFETTRPSAYYGVNVPFPAGWKAGTVLSGSQILRFTPLDLYVMGLIPRGELPDKVRAFYSAKPGEIYKPAAQGSFSAAAGTMMGLKTGVAVRPPKVGDEIQLLTSEIVATAGERSPAFDKAPHHLKQLWILVTKPTDKITMGEEKAHADAVLNVTAWRRQFAAYYYMLTGYRGRVVTSYDGVDDVAYWEFGQPVDDSQQFKAEGTDVKFPGHERIPNSPEIKNVMRFVDTPGGEAGVSFQGKPLALRISGDQSLKAAANAVSVRMRVPAGGPKNAFASLMFPGIAPIRIPASCGNPARSGCTEAAFLVPDGKWRTYAATLSDAEGFTAGTFDTFTFSPSSQPYNSGNDLDGIEVEFIRIANVPSPKDSDKGCGVCSECSKVKDAAARTACNNECKNKDGALRVKFAQSDGWIDSEDNCPNQYNPLQEDGNDDGVGDACEDFDGDGEINACDNCPTTTNSRQRDQDRNGIGDVCDGDQPVPCFLAPDSLGGPMGAAPGVFLGAMFAGVIGLLAFRRRRSR